MTLLRDLLLAENKFTGTLPDSLVELPNIARLDLVSFVRAATFPASLTGSVNDVLWYTGLHSTATYRA